MENRVSCRVTHIGAATVLLEVGSMRLLTDPVFDPAGGRYSFGWGTGSTKLAAPAAQVEAIGRIDAVLLSHDQHEDNLDRTGRALLPRTGRVITTVSGARRLGGNAEGLEPWASAELVGSDGLRVRVTATPARHGPPLSRPFVGEVVGFMLEWQGQRHGALYISGDTVWFRGVAEVGRRFTVGTALLHLGGVRFPMYGPVRFTFGGAGAAKAVRALAPHTVIPIHYDGWQHFRESRAVSERAFAAAGLAERVVWLAKGVATEVEV